MKYTLGELQNKINSGAICPYCLKPTEYINSYEIYGVSYGMVYICKPCQAWVGVHKGTKEALGRLANDELRRAKKETHYYFDQIAKTGLINKIWPEYLPNVANRNKAYIWLSERMRISIEECHIGMFDLDRCGEAIKICKAVLKQKRE